MNAEEILYQLSAIATADTTQLVQIQDGTLEIAPTGQLPKKLRCAIASIEKSAGGIKVKFYDKLKALELLGKYMGLFDGGGSTEKGDPPLLGAILQATGEVTDDAIQTLGQQAAAGDDLVEQEQLL